MFIVCMLERLVHFMYTISCTSIVLNCLELSHVLLSDLFGIHNPSWELTAFFKQCEV